MLTTTANLCETQLLGNLAIYVGTHIGSFKAIKISTDGTGDPHKARSLHSTGDVTKNGKVTCLEWANTDKTELFLGKENQFLKVFSVADNLVINNLLLSGIPVGCVRLSNNSIAAGLTNGNIQLIDPGNMDKEPELLNTGDNMTRMRFCSTKPSLVATGGKERQNNVKVWDLTTKQMLFSSKNVRPSELQLEMPIWDNDISFVTENNLATCSRHGYVRFYDTRSQRRPVTAFQSSDRDQFGFTCLATNGMLAYVGLTVGGIQCYDLRQPKRSIHVYKAATGSISDICVAGENGEYLVSSSLDRFVRIHSTDTNRLLYQNYVQSKVTRILCNRLGDVEAAILGEGVNGNGNATNDEDEEEQLGDILGQLPIAGDDEDEEKDTAPKKRRKRT